MQLIKTFTCDFALKSHSLLVALPLCRGIVLASGSVIVKPVPEVMGGIVVLVIWKPYDFNICGYK